MRISEYLARFLEALVVAITDDSAKLLTQWIFPNIRLPSIVQVVGLPVLVQ
jgi:hypothetical protein